MKLKPAEIVMRLTQCSGATLFFFFHNKHGYLFIIITILLLEFVGKSFFLDDLIHNFPSFIQCWNPSVFLFLFYHFLLPHKIFEYLCIWLPNS